METPIYKRVVWRWVASILLSEGSLEPSIPYGSGMGALQEAAHWRTELCLEVSETESPHRQEAYQGPMRKLETMVGITGLQGGSLQSPTNTSTRQHNARINLDEA